MPPRKRRRSVAFAPEDDDNSTREVDSPFDDATLAEERANSGVWDAFREEYHEGIVYFCPSSSPLTKQVLEQLPLALQRAFILIRELDDQAQCEQSAPERVYAIADGRKANNVALVTYLRQYLQARTNHSRSVGSVTTGTLSSSSSKGLISRVAAITEENSRAAQERVNIAQSAYDSVGPAIFFSGLRTVDELLSLTRLTDKSASSTSR